MNPTPLKALQRSIERQIETWNRQPIVGRMGISAFERLWNHAKHWPYYRNGRVMVGYEGVFFYLDRNIDRLAIEYDEFLPMDVDRWQECENRFAEIRGYPRKNGRLKHEEIF